MAVTLSCVEIAVHVVEVYDNTWAEPRHPSYRVLYCYALRAAVSLASAP